MTLEVKWELEAQEGNFDRIPSPFTWDHSANFAHLLNGYDIIGFEALAALANPRVRAAETGQPWEGSAVELWMCLFFEHRRWRHAGIDPSPKQEAALDKLCETLRQRLLAQTVSEREELLALSKAHSFPGTQNSLRDQ